jgi:hypothetical protein
MRILKTLLPVMAVLAFCGCAGYHLGPVNGAPAGDRTVEVLPFNNQTLQPRLGDALTQALRERFQVDGTYKLVSGKPGDIVVSGTITHYEREGLGYLSADATTPENYRVGATVHVVVRDSATGKLLLDKNIKGHTLVNIGSDLASSERQAAPLLAADAAQNIVAELTEGSW